jgi:pimeloyl-ACP methyl ester carboxylesterase
VLVCSPYFREAISAHRFQRVLADRLARNGHPVLRFDYFGTGDSPGDDVDVDLAGSVGDVVVAIGELLRQTGARRCVVVGTSLGANVALRAAGRVSDEVARLVLVHPILDGAAYLSDLPLKHVYANAQSRSSARCEDPTHEAVGFAVSALLASQIRTISLITEDWERVPATILISESRPDRLPDQVGFLPIVNEANWAGESAAGAQLVPAALVTELIRQAGLP